MPKGAELTARSIARTVLIVVAVLLTIYVLYLLRKPISLADHRRLHRHRRGRPRERAPAPHEARVRDRDRLLVIILIPIGLSALLVPPIVGEVEDVANNAPEYVQDVEDYVNKNETLQNLNDDYDITTKLQEEAQKLPERIPDAAGALSDIGVGFVNSIFAAVTILILSVFMVAGGPRWVSMFVEAQRPEHAERIERTLRRIANAVGNYVGGALLQATIAGLLAFIVLTILGAPFAGPLALVVFFFDLIPVVGATIAAFLVAIVMIFVNFPVALIIWVVFAIAYQQFENYVIQPQIQKRATEIDPFLVLVAVLFGSTLFGVMGAILAIPAAAAILITFSEWRRYLRDSGEGPTAMLPGGPPDPLSQPPSPPIPPNEPQSRSRLKRWLGRRGPSTA